MTRLDRAGVARAALGVRQALGSGRPAPTTGQPYARVGFQRFEACESYTYEQELSLNRFLRARGAATGRVELCAPYDGHAHVGQQAVEDVRRQALDRILVDGQATAHVGHLLLGRHTHTDLRTRLDFDGSGAVPVLLPFEQRDLDEPAMDDRTFRGVVDYIPSDDWPQLYPIELELDLFDPDSLTTEDSLPWAHGTSHARLVDLTAEGVGSQVHFRRHLLVVGLVRVILPAVEGQHPLPRVRRVALDWPTLTSLNALHLDVADRAVDLSYDPESRTVSWEGTPRMFRVSSGDGKPEAFCSEPFLFQVEQPGEFYEQSVLSGQVEVELPDRLLSGLDVRLHDGTGAVAAVTPELSTRLTLHFQLVLDDAFAKRSLSPVQHLHFAGVIPEEMRIADIVTALKDRGFDIDDRRRLPASDTELRSFLEASRREGADRMRLQLRIEGRSYETQRRSQGAGHTYTRTLHSGELSVLIRGELVGDSAKVTHEMNALHLALRDRFDHVIQPD